MFALVGGGIGGILWFRSASATTSLSEADLGFATVQRVTMRDQVSATGVLQARDLVFVASEIPGIVQTVCGKVNQVVRDGTVLARLDERKLRLKLEEAVNGVLTAEAALAQAKALHEAALSAWQFQEEAKKVGLRVDLDEAKAKLKAAQAGVAAAEARLAAALTAKKEAELALDLAVIKVPPGSSTGPTREYLILKRDVEEGQMVGPQGPPLFVLCSGLERMEVHAQVAEGDINKVKVGQTALFAVTSYADEEAHFHGVVREIRPQANNIKGAVYYDTVIDVCNRRDPHSGEWQLRPGMNVSVDIIRTEHRDVWRVPTAALNFQLEEAYQTPAVKARLAEFARRPDRADWHPLWIWDAGRNGPWPLFIRISGLKNGEPGLKDGEGNEILEWEAGGEPNAALPPRVIISAPPARRPGFFDRPANIKVS
ncbi:MAG: efflux RND transporter periplasmic adaptor subunit [Gemmataceae bacterium]|nr:efflux RND transporter periplasmic adaptor subunit [Gemmataceae bacterium]